MSSAAQKSLSNFSVALLMRLRRIECVKMIAQVQMLAASSPSMSVQLTYNNRNLAGDGSLEPANAGLSKLGRKTIERIEAEKLLLDLSHGGAKSMAEAAAYAKRPMVISHTGAKALTDHPRNTADETIKGVADKGGVVGVYFMIFGS